MSCAHTEDMLNDGGRKIKKATTTVEKLSFASKVSTDSKDGLRPEPKRPRHGCNGLFGGVGVKSRVAKSSLGVTRVRVVMAASGGERRVFQINDVPEGSGSKRDGFRDPRRQPG
jgi:hypothetical protein